MATGQEGSWSISYVLSQQCRYPLMLQSNRLRQIGVNEIAKALKESRGEKGIELITLCLERNTFNHKCTAVWSNGLLDVGCDYPDCDNNMRTTR